MTNRKLDIRLKNKAQMLLSPPQCYSIRGVANEIGVSIGAIHTWRQELVDKGVILPDLQKENLNQYTPEQKFSFVLQCATLDEHSLASFCREQGLYVTQIKEWIAISMAAHQVNNEVDLKELSDLRLERKKVKTLEKELDRKNKALAETAALLVLREKFNALWDHSEDV